MVRKSLIGGKALITAVLRLDQKSTLTEMATEDGKARGRYVSISEVIRDAVDMYIAARRRFFYRRNEDIHNTDMKEGKP